MNIQTIAEQIIDLELKTIGLLKNSITNDLNVTIETILHSTGRLVVSGVGKSALVGQKMVATFNSTGTPALFLHAADAMHGDVGMVGPDDVVLIISKSGETEEIKQMMPTIKSFGNKIIAMVCETNSTLAKAADYVLHTPIEREADPFNLIPTASLISQTAMGHVLAICLLTSRGFSKDHFARFHPGGMIGKSLLMKAKDLCSLDDPPKVQIDDDLNTVIVEISNKRLGATAVLNGGKLVGIITDGDLRRMLQKGYSKTITAKELMTNNPKAISSDTLIVDAFSLLKEKNISQLLVTENDNYLGLLHIHAILDEGF